MLDSGASPTIADESGITPLEAARQSLQSYTHIQQSGKGEIVMGNDTGQYARPNPPRPTQLLIDSLEEIIQLLDQKDESE